MTLIVKVSPPSKYNYKYNTFEELLNECEWKKSKVGTKEGNEYKSEVRKSKFCEIKSINFDWEYSVRSGFVKERYAFEDFRILDNCVLLKYEVGDFFSSHTDKPGKSNEY